MDASAVVAVLGREEDWQVLADRLERFEPPLWSAVVGWESVAALRLRLRRPATRVRSMVGGFAAENGFGSVSVGERAAALALDAFERYGKGTGHPAQLNMGDCFDHACAKANGAALLYTLLYKRDDINHTDLA